MEIPVSKLTKSQFQTHTRVKDNLKVKLTIRYDDECNNGHNSFAMTADLWEGEKSRFDEKTTIWRNAGGGCCHTEIADVFPEFAKYIKWHLVSSDMPMHYTSNPLYLAGDRDCWGLRKGESRQIRNGKTGLPAWELVQVEGPELPRYVDSETKPEGRIVKEYRPWCRIGEGKEPQLEAARSSAVWPEAQLEDFTEEKLLARLPQLMNDFKKDMEELGFVY